MPQEWRDVVLLPLFKKGDKKVCDNYRGISLLSAAGKAFEKTIQLRMQKWAEGRNILPESQQGFRKNRGCTDAIHCLRLAMEAARTGGHELHMAFVDLSKAYDSVAREGLWQLLERLGVPPKMLAAVRQLHEGAQAVVEVEGRFSEAFELRTGVKQGSGLSPLLFNIYAAAVFWEWQREYNGDLTHLWNLDGVLSRHHNALRSGKKAATGEQQTRDLQYADDAVLLAWTRAVPEVMPQGYQKVARRWALDMSVKKTKALAVGAQRYDIQVEDCGDEAAGVVEGVGTFTYLGSDTDLDVELEKRAQKAQAAYAKLEKTVWGVRELTVATKRMVYVACVLSVLLYGAEVWPVSWKQLGRLERLHASFARRILGVSRMQQHITHTTNADLVKRLGVQPVRELYVQRVLRWLGHVARQEPERLPKRFTFGWLPPRDAPGSTNHLPGLRYCDVAHRALDMRGVDRATWYALARKDHGETWREVVRGSWDPAAAALPGAAAEAESSDGEEDTVCQICGDAFRGRGGLAAHVQLAHTEGTDRDQEWNCTEASCGRKFTNQGRLTLHTRE